MEKPVIFFLLHFAQDPSCFFRRLDLPPEPSPMKIVSMEKKEDRIFDPWILIKIFRQDDKEPFLFPQRFREKGLGSNQVLKPLGGLGREKIRKLAIFRATERISTGGPNRPC
jgi:hypothetical protein